MSRRTFCKALLTFVAAVFCLSLFSTAVFAQGRSDEGLERAIAAQEKHTEVLMAIKGVVGTAVGIDQNNVAVVKVLTARGAVAGIPGRLDGVRVQPVVTGEFYALPKPDKTGKPDRGDPVDPTARFDRPVPIGVSTGHPDITAGTIGCRVLDGGVFVLSNNHVYAASNAASAGNVVIQPGIYDGGTLDDAIGTLSDFVLIDFDNYPLVTNTVDAAIAEIIFDEDVPRVGNATPSDGYGTPKSTTAEAYINQKVKKYGRTTGLTKGQVYALNVTVDVDYREYYDDPPKLARFINQIIITPGGFSAGGDSGSLIVVDGKGRNKADDRRPVGLLFAGSDFYTIANPIGEVLDSFGVTIDGD